MALLAVLAFDVSAQDPTQLVVIPPGRSLEMRVGERRGFSAVLAEPGVQYAWSLDGTPSGQGSQFEFHPTAAYVGRHEVSVTALVGPNAARHTWLVTVEAVGAPTIVRAAPSMAVVRVPATEPLQFELQVEPATLTDRVTVRWTIDGVPAGEGPILALRAPAMGTQRVRAVASGEYGSAVMREWQLVATARVEGPVPVPDVVPDPEFAEIVRRTAPAASTRASPPKPAAPAVPAKPSGKVAVPPAPVTPKPRLPRAPVGMARAKPPVTPPAPAGVSEDDARALMFRYERAWRTRNVGELRRIGYVNTDDQERALLAYFTTSRDVEVSVHVLELRIDGERGIVRFTQHDGFRDAEGREVSADSAPIEKTMVRTPKGVHFAPHS